MNINTIERIEMIPAIRCRQCEFEYIPERTNFFGKIIPEHIIDRLAFLGDKNISLKEFEEKYKERFFLKKNTPYRKAHVIIYFVSGYHEIKYFNSDIQANDYYTTFNQDYFINL